MEETIIETEVEATEVAETTGGCENCTDAVTDCSVCQKGAVVE